MTPSCLLLGSFCRLAFRNYVQVTALFSFAVFSTDQPGVYTGAVYVEKLAQPMSPTHRRGAGSCGWCFAVIYTLSMLMLFALVCFIEALHSLIDMDSGCTLCSGLLTFGWRGYFPSFLSPSVWANMLSKDLSTEMLKDYVKMSLIGRFCSLYMGQSFWCNQSDATECLIWIFDALGSEIVLSMFKH